MSVATANGVARPSDYLDAGLSVIPIRADGTKAPAINSWKQYQSERATAEDSRHWFIADNVGVAIIHGAVSGNSELIDIDSGDVFGPYCAEVERLAPGLIARLTIIQTPRPGYHIVYRCDEIDGNQKLAMSADRKVLIETRGQGGYALAPGSPGECHETGRTYDHHSGPKLTELPTISPEERTILFRVAASFNELVEESPAAHAKPMSTTDGQSPGDDFNQRADWSEILIPHGWEITHASGDKTFWRRPGKSVGWSATTGIKSTSGNDLFCCFSDNAHPFQGANGRSACTSYTKFAAYTALNHGGDYSAAAKQLTSDGYGDRSQQRDNSLESMGPVQHGEQEQQQPEPIVYTRLTSKELASGNYAQEYMVEGTMVARQPLLVCGSKKTLKTSLLVDAGVSLSTGGYFLGRLPVKREYRTAIFSGESGLATLQETARRICFAAGLFLDDLKNLIWSPDIPMFGRLDHLDAFERFIKADDIEVAIVDPTYLAMPGSDAGNLFVQGELLRGINERCQANGVTLVLAHHAKTHTGRDVFSPPELEDIAWAGFQEFARQWWLIGRRERYEPGSGDHRLWLNVGGSAGHSAMWAVDVSEGLITDEGGRKWEVELSKPSEAIDDAEARKEATKVAAKQKQQEDDLRALLDATASLENQSGTKTAIKDATGINPVRFNVAFSTALKEKYLSQTEITKGNNRKYDGYKLSE